ncbi:MAG: hypothetical protein IT450_24050 [Phycisphaerales bacterium]|nr:hypothetical protein [Phycisphaerales bacterium]
MRAHLMLVPLALASIIAPAAGQAVYYDINPATVMEADFCLGPCDCALPTLIGSATGRFTLRFDHAGPLFDVYRVEDLFVVADIPDFQPIRLVGDGEYRIGGEFARLHQLRFDAELYGRGGEALRFDSGLVTADPRHPFPAIGIHVESERPELSCIQIRLDLAAAPDACPADLDDSGDVGLADLAILLGGFGRSGDAAHADGDLDADRDVDLADLSRLLADFGTACR